MGYKKQVFRSLAMVTQLGLSVMTPIFLCILAGYCVDRYLHVNSILIFLLLGVLSGGYSGWRMIHATLRAAERDDERERRERLQEARKNSAHRPVSRPKEPSRVRGVSKLSDGKPEQAGHEPETKPKEECE